MQQTPAIFIAGDPALDFLNSVATPVDVPVEWLDDGEGLLDWLRQAQLVPAPVLKAVRARSSPRELDEVAEQARNLREWFRGFVDKERGRPLARDSLRKLERLNRLLARDESFGQIAPAAGADGGALERLHLHQGMRGTRLHAALCRSNPGPGASLVQHGDLRESSQAGSSPAQEQGGSIALCVRRAALQPEIVQVVTS
jgi:hypothetical protein